QNTDQIIRVARAVPHLLTERVIDHLRDEWLTYSIETIDEKWIIKSVVKDSTGNGVPVFDDTNSNLSPPDLPTT
ncbi:unnamed protein product, partial [Rotaria sp. Silwood2]